MRINRGTRRWKPDYTGIAGKARWGRRDLCLGLGEHLPRGQDGGTDTRTSPSPWAAWTPRRYRGRVRFSPERWAIQPWIDRIDGHSISNTRAGGAVPNQCSTAELLSPRWRLQRHNGCLFEPDD